MYAMLDMNMNSITTLVHTAEMCKLITIIWLTFENKLVKNNLQIRKNLTLCQFEFVPVYTYLNRKTDIDDEFSISK